MRVNKKREQNRETVSTEGLNKTFQLAAQDGQPRRHNRLLQRRRAHAPFAQAAATGKVTCEMFDLICRVI